MKEKREDLRIIRTKKLLRDALFSMLQEDSIENITVNGICDRAMVHRTTFYKHYEDKYRLLASLMLELQKSFMLPEDTELKCPDRKTLYLLVTERFFINLSKKKEAYRRILKNNQGGVMLRICYDVTETAVKQTAASFGEAPDLTVPVTMSAHFFAGGLASVALWYLQNDRNESAEDMKKHMSKLLCSTCTDASHDD